MPVGDAASPFPLDEEGGYAARRWDGTTGGQFVFAPLVDEQCVFLPQCTEFDRCPNRAAYDACFRQEKRKLETELRFAYAVYQERRRQTRQEDARERKETPDVSD